MQSALKEGSAKQVIEGLSCSGKYYAEAIECLCSRFIRPRLIHQTHVKMILDATPLKDGNGRELRCLHDTAQQNLCALKVMVPLLVSPGAQARHEHHVRMEEVQSG